MYTSRLRMCRAPLMETLPHSFLRHLIPLHVRGAGATSNLLRHAFLHRNELIPYVLRAVEQVDLPLPPRLLFAEAFQRLLDGVWPQREVRAMFDEAIVESRRMLYEAPTRVSAVAPCNVSSHRAHTSHRPDKHVTTSSASSFACENDAYRRWCAVHQSPLHRLLAYELCAACEYFASLLGITHTPALHASVCVRARVMGDVCSDALLVAATQAFVDAGDSPKLHDEAFLEECLLLERDVLGRCHRFDLRGGTRYLVHSIALRELARDWQSCALLERAAMRRCGNWTCTRRRIHDGRWCELSLRCAEEDHRLLSFLPLRETLCVGSEHDGSSIAATTQAETYAECDMDKKIPLHASSSSSSTPMCATHTAPLSTVEPSSSDRKESSRVNTGSGNVSALHNMCASSTSYTTAARREPCVRDDYKGADVRKGTEKGRPSGSPRLLMWQGGRTCAAQEFSLTPGMSAQEQMLVCYDLPICLFHSRDKASTVNYATMRVTGEEEKDAHTEIIQLASPNDQRTFWEKWFLDR